MRRLAAHCSFAALAMLATAETPEPAKEAPANPGEMPECPKADSDEVAVAALRFSDGRSYSFRVTNNGTRPIVNVAIGWGGDTFIEGSFNNRPTSIGSPSGWKGMHTAAQDPRLPGSHSHPLILYQWFAENPDARIQPGRSLSGFSVQLPTPEEAVLAYLDQRERLGVPAERQPKGRPLEERLRPQPDLTKVHFEVRTYLARCPAFGTVELDSGSGADDAGNTQPRSGP